MIRYQIGVRASEKAFASNNQKAPSFLIHVLPAYKNTMPSGRFIVCRQLVIALYFVR